MKQIADGFVMLKECFPFNILPFEYFFLGGTGPLI